MSYAARATAQAAAISALLRKATGVRPNPRNRSAYPRIEVRAGSPGPLISVHGETDRVRTIQAALDKAGYSHEDDWSHDEDDQYVTIRVTGRTAKES